MRYYLETEGPKLEEGGVRLVSGGTDNHLMLCDVTPYGITGKDAQFALDDVNIVVNKNTIPYDKQKPFITSGVRIGTPCVTTRGMKEAEMNVIGDVIADTLKNHESKEVKSKNKEIIASLAKKFPVYF